MILTYGTLITCVKLLLLPAYKSTDFEVHRNWLAITHNQPVRRWYFDETSQWTLDYPPLFAYFEWFLSLFARLFHDEMLVQTKLEYSSPQTVVFQRLSVILSDFVFLYGIKLCSKVFPKGKRSDTILPILLIANPGLLMLDHVHFQYNGFLYGILLISIANILQDRPLSAAFWFTILLNLKHIYLYIAPTYFIYLLRNYCFTQPSSKKLKNNAKTTSLQKYINWLKTFSIGNVSKLGAIVIAVFIATYAPFYDHLGQVFSRLFPFKRGLCHAYWAPNVWAIYNGVDKAAVIIASKIGIAIKNNVTQGAMTGGLVQEFAHAILPQITPLMTLLLTGIAMLPALYKLWTTASNGNKANNFLRCLTLCALSSFMFGWHVHEKAILMAIIPLSIVATIEPGDANAFLVLSTIGHYSLFPLLYPPNLQFIKLLLLLLYSSYAFYSLFNLYPFQFCRITLPLLNTLESIYLLGLIPLYVYSELLHYLVTSLAHLPFLPLMMTSIYCAIGVCYVWTKYYIYFMAKCKY